MLHPKLFVALIVLPIADSEAALAATPVPAVDLGVTEFSPSAGRDVNAAGRIYVRGPAALDGRPSGVILLLAAALAAGALRARRLGR